MSMDENLPTPSSEPELCVETSFWTPQHGPSGTVVIDVRSWDEMFADIERQGDALDPVPRITFRTYELMHDALSPNRMVIVRTMTGQGPMSIREVARRVGRDFKGVHSDVTKLTQSGVLQKTADGQVIFPYANIHFDFVFGATDQSAA